MKCVVIFFETYFKEGLKLAPYEFLIDIFYIIFFFLAQAFPGARVIYLIKSDLSEHI